MKKDTVAIAVLAALVMVFTSPLLIHGGALDLFPKNFLRDSSYFDLTMIKKSVFEYGQIPLWVPGFEGGSPLLAHPGDASLNPVSTLLVGVLRDEVLGDNLTWVVFYVLGAGSMYYFCRVVLNYNILGALLSSLVFSMNGLFPYFQENGLTQAQPALLLPLLAGFLWKTKQNGKYIIYASMVLAFFIFQGALFVPVTALFLFFLVFVEAFSYDNKTVIFDKRPLVILGVVFGLGFLLACVKIMPMLTSFGTQVRPSGLPYENYIVSPNTFEMLFRRLLLPVNAWPGMFVGVLPVALCVLAALVCFKRMMAYVAGLVLAVWLSFGPNAFVDLHKVLWHLPFFHEMKEISKYYGLFIIFFISILSGGVLVSLDRFRDRVNVKAVGISILVFVFLSLAWFNIGYFNSFNTRLAAPDAADGHEFFNMQMANGHPGDESITTPLSYFLYQRNIGLINQYIEFKQLTSVSPRFVLLPRYALLMPYTSLLVLPNPGYRGEVYCLNSKSRVSLGAFSFNQLILDVETHGPDRLVLNQNYDRGWRASQGVVEAYGNLLSVRLDTPVNGKIRMAYLPLAFVMGAVISGLAFVLSMVYLVKASRKCA